MKPSRKIPWIHPTKENTNESVTPSHRHILAYSPKSLAMLFGNMEKHIFLVLPTHFPDLHTSVLVFWRRLGLVVVPAPWVTWPSSFLQYFIISLRGSQPHAISLSILLGSHASLCLPPTAARLYNNIPVNISQLVLNVV